MPKPESGLESSGQGSSGQGSSGQGAGVAYRAAPSSSLFVHPRRGERIVVAMSGGVDSCASAVLLHEQGYEVVGISMQVWDYRKNGGSASRATCCAPSDFDDAREIAEHCGFSYYVFDFESSFRKSVIDPFIDSYLKGETPNPCLNCNRKVKFKELRQRAVALQSQWVATGHFAQIKQKPDGALALYTSVDGNKDQTYFLYSMTPEDLRQTLFPVGGMRKPEVRALLESRGHHVATKAESQDICFVSTSVADFIERQRGAQPYGKLVTQDGATLGIHRGVHQYTVGQRKGLGLSSAHPLYVLKIDPESNDVTVGSKDDLARDTFEVDEMNWVSGSPPSGEIEAIVKVRYRHPGVRCRIRQVAQHRFQFEFLDEWTAVSPGQAAVCYGSKPDSDGTVEVLGGGVISK